MNITPQSFIDSLFQPIKFNFDQSSTKYQLKPKKQSKDAPETEKADICCKRCQAKITHPSHAIEINGNHYHVFTNPEGVKFEIGLFEQANCLAVSPAILEHTWFAGYTWQIVVCPECNSHLGWSYTKQHSPDFYGLIVDRLNHL